MSDSVKGTPSNPAMPDEDPWRYGWRYQRQEGPDGELCYVQTPLASADILHPQEDDFVVHNDNHGKDRHYLDTMLTAHLNGRKGVYVFCDHRIDWGVPGLEPHGPDLTVIDGYPADWDRQRGTFCLSEFGAKPLLVLEITSPATRHVDLDEKVLEYHQAGVPFCAIVDRRYYPEGQEIRLLGYRFTEEGYARVKLDEYGWLLLEPIELWLAVEGNRLRCYYAN
ncbi:MAG: Uma2 family endonuclease, partial [Gemmataceae bacterium]